MPTPKPRQLQLPLAPQPPAPAQVQAELVRMWRTKPGMRQRWKTLDALLGCPDRARALHACVERLLLARQREALHRLRPT